MSKYGGHLYAVLGVSPDASVELIKSAYRTLAKQYHPDLGGSGQADATSKFIELQEAYQILTDPVARSDYDKRHQSQAQEFDSSKDDNNTAQIDPDEVWKSVAREHPEIDAIHAHLLNISKALANRFRIGVIDHEYSEEPGALARELERAFFEKYFGASSEVVEFAKRLLATGHRDAARQLNRAVNSGRLENGQARAIYISKMQRRYFRFDRSPEDRQKKSPSPRSKADVSPKTSTIKRNFGIALGILLLFVTSGVMFYNLSAPPITAVINPPEQVVSAKKGALITETIDETPKLALSPEQSRGPLPQPDSADPSDTEVLVLVEPPSAEVNYVAQVASLRSEAEARAELDRLRDSHGNLIGNIATRITKATVSGNTRFRLGFGPLQRSQAAKLCSSLIAAGERDCAVRSM